MNHLKVVSRLTVVSVDAQRRIYLPKALFFNAKKAVIIPQGDSYRYRRK